MMATVKESSPKIKSETPGPASIASSDALLFLNERLGPFDAETEMNKLPHPLRMMVEQLESKYTPASRVLDALMAHYYQERCDLIEQAKRAMEWDTSDLKRKRPHVSSPMKNSASPMIPAEILGKSQYHIKQLSFLTPRKKLELKLYDKHLVLWNSTQTVMELVIVLKEIKYMLCLPTPNKLKPHWTMALILEDYVQEPIVFGFDAHKDFAILDASSHNVCKQFKDAPFGAMKHVFEKVVGKPMILSTKSKNVCIDCYLGSKEGHVYLLNQGIFFGFKKPVLYIAHSTITDMVVTSKTSKTFNMIIHSTADVSKKGFEFCMIDINEFDLMMNYINECRPYWAQTSESSDEDASETVPMEAMPTSIKTAHFLSDEEADEDFQRSSSDSSEELEFTEDEQGDLENEASGESDSEKETTSPSMSPDLPSDEQDELDDD